METARRHPRANVTFGVDVVSYSAGVSQRDEARLIVLSSGGAFLELDGDYAVGSILKLGFTLPSTTEAITGLAIVRDRLTGSGVGVEFLDLEPRDRERITAFVNRHLSADR